MATQLGPDVQARLKVCRVCPFWLNRCLKNHNLNSLVGCPERRFPPVGNAGYAPNITLTVGVANSSASCCGKSQPPTSVDETLRPVHTKLTGGQVAAQFAKSMIAWERAGFARVDPARHTARYVGGCQKCPHYRHYVCTKCHCVAYLKTKLATETCPDVPPRWH